jgi:hypothetical protein
MDQERKRELKRQAREFKPQMGVVSFTCEATGDVFFAAAKNVPAYLNRTRLQVETGTLRNKRLQELWRAHGEDAIAYDVVEDLDYEDGVTDYTDDLDVLLEECLAAHPEASRL